MKENELRLCRVISAEKDSSQRHIVYFCFDGGIKGKITFLEENIFRYDVDPSGEFAAYAKPVDEKHAARIQQRPDDSKAYTRPEAAAVWGYIRNLR